MSGAPFSENIRNGRLSIAYIQAVAARAGNNSFEPKVDMDSVDIYLKAKAVPRLQIDIQAKAASMNIVPENTVKFSLSTKNYDDLRAQKMIPHSLVVFVMPENSVEWLTQSENELALRRRAYSVLLQCRPASPNISTMTASLPRTQIFDEQQLSDLMLIAEKGPIL